MGSSAPNFASDFIETIRSPIKGLGINGIFGDVMRYFGTSCEVVGIVDVGKGEREVESSASTFASQNLTVSSVSRVS